MRKALALFFSLLVILMPALALAHGKGHVKGTVAAVASDHIEVTREDGKTVSIPLTPKTTVFRGKTKVQASDAGIGQRVSVHLAADGSAMEVRLSSAVKAK